VRLGVPFSTGIYDPIQSKAQQIKKPPLTGINTNNMENNKQNSNTNKPMTAEENSFLKDINKKADEIYPCAKKFQPHKPGTAIYLGDALRKDGFIEGAKFVRHEVLPIYESLEIVTEQSAYLEKQTADLRKQLAEKEAEIEKLKSLRRFDVDYCHEDGYVESDISEDKDGEWVKWSDIERILSQKGAGDE